MDSHDVEHAWEGSASSQETSYVEKALGLALLLILVVGCVLVLMPFLNAILLAVTLCVSTWPLYRRTERLLGGRRTLAAMLMTMVNRKERAHECFRLNGSTAPAVCSGTAQGPVRSGDRVDGGIGLGIAEALAAAGADVLLNGFGQPAEIDRVRRSLAEGTACACPTVPPTCRSPPKSTT